MASSIRNKDHDQQEGTKGLGGRESILEEGNITAINIPKEIRANISTEIMKEHSENQKDPLEFKKLEQKHSLEELEEKTETVFQKAK